MHVDKALRVRPRRLRVLAVSFWTTGCRTLLLVCIVGCARLSLVGSQKDADFSGTPNARLLERTLVNLHDGTLEANKDLDLSTDDPADAARQVLARIGSNVSLCHRTLSILFLI